MDYYQYNQNDDHAQPDRTVPGRNQNDRRMEPDSRGTEQDGRRLEQDNRRLGQDDRQAGAAPAFQDQQPDSVMRRPPMVDNLFHSIISKKEFVSISGTVMDISNFSANGCTKLFQIVSPDGNTTNLVIQPDTYFINHIRIGIGMPVTAFYDAKLPTPLIYPPQYKAAVVALETQWENIKVDRFNRSLLSDDGTLKLNISDSTEIILENGQEYTGSLANRYLIVLYGSSSRSIPAQTTPRKIIVMCD